MTLRLRRSTQAATRGRVAVAAVAIRRRAAQAVSLRLRRAAQAVTLINLLTEYCHLLCKR